MAFPGLWTGLRVRRDAEEGPVSGVAVVTSVEPRATTPAASSGAPAPVLAVAGVVVGLGPA